MSSWLVFLMEAPVDISEGYLLNIVIMVSIFTMEASMLGFITRSS